MFSKRSLLGVGLALLFLVAAFWKVDLGQLLTSLAAVNYSYVFVAALVTLAGYVLRTLRWRSILHPTQPMTVRALFPIMIIGFMANNVLPARAGEVVRAYVLQRRTGIAKTHGLATIILERMFDGLTLVLFIGVLSLRFPMPEWGTELARVAAAIFFGGAALLVIVLLRGDLAARAALSIAHRLPSRFQLQANRMVQSALLGLQSLQRRRTLLIVLLLSLSVWLAEAVSYFLIIRGFDPVRVHSHSAFSPGTMILAAAFLLVVVNLAIMLPSAPGYVGTFQAFGVLALSAFDVAPADAMGISIVSHGMQYLLITGLGLVFLWQGRLSLSRAAVEGSAP